MKANLYTDTVFLFLADNGGHSPLFWTRVWFALEDAIRSTDCKCLKPACVRVFIVPVT
jgi:hypothetical protein